MICQLVTDGCWLLLQGGMYVLQLMDYYSAGFCVLVIAILECLVINWIYGQCCVKFFTCHHFLVLSVVISCRYS